MRVSKVRSLVLWWDSKLEGGCLFRELGKSYEVTGSRGDCTGHMPKCMLHQGGKTGIQRPRWAYSAAPRGKLNQINPKLSTLNPYTKNPKY